MGLRVVLYEASHVPAVRAFNARMRAADALLFPIQESAPAPNPQTPEEGIEFSHFVVIDDAGEVRGGYFTRTQPFYIRGEVRPVAHYTAPLSEGLIDKRFAPVGAAMLLHALGEQPLLFAMGMGGRDKPLPRMLTAMGWTILETPFLFFVLNGRRFLRNIGPLRERTERRLLADAMSFSGLGGLAIAAVQRFRKRSRADCRYTLQPIPQFGEWADRIWLESAPQYSLSAVRSSPYLQFIYPPDRGSSYYGMQLTAGERPAGWVEMLDCHLLERSYFGDMRVAALADGVAPAAAIPSLIRASLDAAKQHNADMVISNQMHRDWISALKAAGFWQGPSNYLLALSKPLRKLLEPLAETMPLIHFNRGDGDGRVNLTAPAKPDFIY